MTQDELVAWLRQQLDDDERMARAAADNGAEWRYSDSGIYPSNKSRHPGALVVGGYGYLDEAYGEHIARHDPARVLADVDAKRRILDQCADVWAHDRVEAFAEDVLRLLALAYADRPGYRGEWRP